MESPNKRIKPENHSNKHTSIKLCDDVINIIFSFLPLKSAVKFGVMSKRHIYSWKANLNLDFGKENMQYISQRKYIDIIDQILKDHVGSKVCSFRLYFYPKNNYSKLEEWIRFVTLKGVEELDLDFSAGRGYSDFPNYLLNCSSIVNLKLSCCRLDLSEIFYGLGSLTNIVLQRVDITEGLIQILFHNCLRLVSVSIIQCRGVRVLKVSALRQKYFKKLRVLYSGFMSLEVDAPKLSVLDLYGIGLQRFSFSNNTTELNDVIFNFTSVSESIDVLGIFLALTHVTTLTINVAFVEGLQRQPVCLLNLKELQLMMEGNSCCNPYDIALFLSNCPHLESVLIDLNGFSFNCGPTWEEHDMIPFEQLPFSFSHLKSVKVKGFKIQKYEYLLVKFFLQKAPVLEKLVVITPRNRQLKTKVKDVELCRKVFRIWQKSPWTEILILPNTSDIR